MVCFEYRNSLEQPYQVKLENSIVPLQSAYQRLDMPLPIQDQAGKVFSCFVASQGGDSQRYSTEN